MTNLNPDKYGNVINPYTLPKSEQIKIMERIDDKRLTNPPGDYFQLNLDCDVIDIPKLRQISQQTADGKVSTVSVIDYIQQQLNK
ncbi:MAG: hypothetical protein WD335_01720 [Candidatus Paceibacterota bacterium]